MTGCRTCGIVKELGIDARSGVVWSKNAFRDPVKFRQSDRVEILRVIRRSGLLALQLGYLLIYCPRARSLTIACSA